MDGYNPHGERVSVNAVGFYGEEYVTLGVHNAVGILIAGCGWSRWFWAAPRRSWIDVTRTYLSESRVYRYLAESGAYSSLVEVSYRVETGKSAVGDNEPG